MVLALTGKGWDRVGFRQHDNGPLLLARCASIPPQVPFTDG
jgi:hypothetical protein